MTNRQGIMRALLWYLCAALAVALDQISKYAATQFLQGKPSVVVIDGADVCNQSWRGIFYAE